MAGLKQKVALEGVRFFAYHGFYTEEQVIGNVFIVDIITEFELTETVDDLIENTVNYEDLFKIAHEEMRITRKLLETVVNNILQQVKNKFTFLDAIQVSIRKVSPPFPVPVSYSLVQLNYSR